MDKFAIIYRCSGLSTSSWQLFYNYVEVTRNIAIHVICSRESQSKISVSTMKCGIPLGVDLFRINVDVH
jgi:hypothetical protein